MAAGAVFSTADKAPRIEKLGATTLLGRGADVAEIAQVIAFLASDKASYVTERRWLSTAVAPRCEFPRIGGEALPGPLPP